MKKCFKCGQEKPLDEFYKHGEMGDGHIGKCKECTRRDVRENRAKNREHYLAFDRARAKLPHRIEMRKQYAQSERGKEVHMRCRKKYIEKNPDVYTAHLRVTAAIAGGKLTRPSICSSCGHPGIIHAHHDDYSKPLEVIWLCSACHIERHRSKAGELCMN
jgi:hypothetical protein